MERLICIALLYLLPLKLYFFGANLFQILAVNVVTTITLSRTYLLLTEIFAEKCDWTHMEVS